MNNQKQKRTIEWAIERLEICQGQAFQSCEREECQQCGLMPDECTRTDCAQTCQCSTCDHCGNESAITELRALLAPPADAAYAPSEPSGARMEMSDEWTQEVFSKRMLRKLDASAAKGRTGWQQCGHANLSQMLREHVEKGDPVDVANFCMFLDALGFSIAPAAQHQGEPVAIEWPDYHSEGMGCGLEDRGITDRYEACRYGFEEAVERCAELFASEGGLYLHPAKQPVDAVVTNTSWMTDAELDAIFQPGSGNKAKRRIEAINKARGEA